jgi:hypothetical protein
VALKQWKAEPDFEGGDFAADRTLGQAQLFCGMSQIQMPRGNDKGLNGSKRERTTRHRTSRYDFLSWLL